RILRPDLTGCLLRKSGGRGDATGEWLVGAKLKEEGGEGQRVGATVSALLRHVGGMRMAQMGRPGLSAADGGVNVAFVIAQGVGPPCWGSSRLRGGRRPRAGAPPRQGGEQGAAGTEDEGGAPEALTARVRPADARVRVGPPSTISRLSVGHIAARPRPRGRHASR